jgi:hypothetical protein
VSQLLWLHTRIAKVSEHARQLHAVLIQLTALALPRLQQQQ